MKEGMDALSQAVRSYRNLEGISQDKLAERLDFAKRTINSIEAATGNPKMDTLFPLIRELHIDANRIFYPEAHQGESALSEFTYFLSTCTEEEIRDLFIICKSVLSTLRERDSRRIRYNAKPIE